jgi:hypothetical protein
VQATPNVTTGVCLIPLRDKTGAAIAYALVDAEDYERISEHRWSYDYRGYAIRGERSRSEGKQRTVRMHREILGAATGLDVDHINRNKLDNRRSNLRSVERAENIGNQARNGVRWDKAQQRWAVVIGQKRYGSYETEDEARQAAFEVRLRGAA